FDSDPIERILALFIFPDKDPFIFAPALEVGSVKESGWEYPVFGYLDHEDAFALIKSHINALAGNHKKWDVEQDNITVEKTETKFVENISPFINKQRSIKNEDEINLLLEAGKWADYAFKVGFDALSTNKTEQAVAAEIEYELKKKGVMHMSFDTIIQSGANAADPHGAPKEDTIKPNELTLFDLGTVYKGYISDASRTVAFGEID